MDRDCIDLQNTATRCIDEVTLGLRNLKKHFHDSTCRSGGMNSGTLPTIPASSKAPASARKDSLP